jgi:hypothetical protein
MATARTLFQGHEIWTNCKYILKDASSRYMRVPFLQTRSQLGGAEDRGMEPAYATESEVQMPII